MVDEITAAGGEAVADTNSVATPEGGEAIVQTALDAFGRVDIVINNAGILRDKSFHNMTPDLLDPVIDVHLKGAFNVTKPAWVRMREQGYGRIVSTVVGGRHLRQLRPDQLRRREDGPRRASPGCSPSRAPSTTSRRTPSPRWRSTRMTEDILARPRRQARPEVHLPARDLPRPRVLRGDRPGVLGRAAGASPRCSSARRKGYFDRDLTPESLADNWATVTDRDGYTVPANIGEETALYLPFLG